MLAHYRSLLDDAWRHRRAQDLPACMDLLSELKADLSLPYTRLQQASIPQILEPAIHRQPPELLAIAIETLILWASLLRAQKELPVAKNLLSFVESVMGQLPHGERRAVIAKLAQEQGLNAYASGDFSIALEHFAVQGRLGATVVERAMGQVNGLLCYDALGLPTQSIHQRARDAVAEVRHSGGGLAAELQNTIIDFERWQAFSRGDLVTLFDSDLGETRFSAYMRAWMSNLPWHVRFNDATRLTPLIAAMSPDAGPLYLQDFRLRTLQGMSLPQDAQQMPASELAVRAYIWTWRWLLDPEAFDVQRILDTLASPVLLENPTAISPCHAHMLRNAAHWISLFCASHTTRFERWSKALPLVHSDRFAVFTWENLLIRFIEAKHQQKRHAAADIRSVAKSLPAGADNGILFGDLITALEHPEAVTRLLELAPWLTPLLRNLGATLNGSSFPSGSGDHGAASSGSVVAPQKVVVDLLTHEIKKGQTAQISRGIALGLALLKSRGQMSRADFIAMVWGLHNYEPGIHDIKILNLLARMRPIVGSDVRLGVKDHLVFGVGAWECVEVIGSLQHVTDLSQAKVALRQGAQWRAPDHPEHSATRRARALLEDHVARTDRNILTRRDIEDILDLPRSSANRMIERLTRQNILAPKGCGPKRYYELKTKWEVSI